MIEAENILTDIEGPAMHALCPVDARYIQGDIFKAMGTSLTLARDIAPMLREEGFVDVQERLVTMQIGKSNKNEQLERQGAWSTPVVARGLIGHGKRKPILELNIYLLS